MNGTHALLIVGIGVLFSGPALAGQPDNPQEKRDIVEFNRKDQQAKSGPSGWGDRVSHKATSQPSGNQDSNFGSYINENTSGPDPSNDNGSGND